MCVKMRNRRYQAYMSTHKYELNMCEGSVLKTVLLFAFPVMLASALQLMYNAADLIVVSRYAGSNAMAAVGATASPTALMLNVFMGMSLGTSVLVSRAFGAQDAEGMHKVVHTSILLAVLLGLFSCVIGLWFTRPLLMLMDTPEGTVLDGAVLYMRIIFIGVPASIVFNFGAAILRAIGDTKRPLYILALSGLVNVLLNLFFVIVCGMDVAGVAIATIVANYLSAIAVLAALIRTDGAYRLNIRMLKIYKDALKEILRIGVPAGLQSSVFALANTVGQTGINSFGADTIKGATAGNNLENFATAAMSAFNQAALTGVSQNYGAKNEKRINKYLMVPLLCSAISGAVIGGLCVLFARPLLGIYITDSPGAIESGATRLLFSALPYFLVGIMECVNGTIRGLGYSTIPTITSLVGVCGLRVSWILFVLPQFHYEEVLFAAWPISWIFVLICHSITLAIIKPKAIKKMYEQC